MAAIQIEYTIRINGLHRCFVGLYLMKISMHQEATARHILPPTNRRVVQQPVTWRDQPITAVIKLLFKSARIQGRDT